VSSVDIDMVTVAVDGWLTACCQTNTHPMNTTNNRSDRDRNRNTAIQL